MVPSRSWAGSWRWAEAVESRLERGEKGRACGREDCRGLAWLPTPSELLARALPLEAETRELLGRYGEAWLGRHWLERGLWASSLWWVCLASSSGPWLSVYPVSTTGFQRPF